MAEILDDLDFLPAADFTRAAWADSLRNQLEQCILPYWSQRMLDPRGGIYGGRDNDGSLRDDLPRSAVLGTRVLWTFATAARLMPHPVWQASATHAWKWLVESLWDEKYGGVFWSVDAKGAPLNTRKHSFVQGFAIYASAAYYQLTNSPVALVLAQECFAALDAAYDAQFGGYIEGCSRDWTLQEDARLSDKEMLAPKSMNTLLHLLEGFTELHRVWRNPKLEMRLRELVELFVNRIWQPDSASFGLHFSRDWKIQSDRISYGHDIKTGWLLCRAAEVLRDPVLQRHAGDLSVLVADAVLQRGVARDGSVLYEGDKHRVLNDERQWWCQAEAMVGFWDAYERLGVERHRQAAWNSWRYIERHFVNPAGDDWFKVLDANGVPKPGRLKAGPWECPYHHARACFEIIARLNRGGEPA